MDVTQWLPERQAWHHVSNHPQLQHPSHAAFSACCQLAAHCSSDRGRTLSSSPVPSTSAFLHCMILTTSPDQEVCHTFDSVLENPVISVAVRALHSGEQNRTYHSTWHQPSSHWTEMLYWGCQHQHQHQLISQTSSCDEYPVDASKPQHNASVSSSLILYQFSLQLQQGHAARTNPP